MKNYSLFAVLLLAATILFACNEIDNVGFDMESAVEQQMAGKTHSINVSQSEASGIADMFMRSEAGTLGVATKSADTKRISSSATVREDGQDLMYVFNYEDGGFVIVGSTRNYYPILAYSDKGSFVLQDDMGPVDVWLDETKVSIKNSSSLDAATKAQMQNLWSHYDGTYVDPAEQLLASRRPQTRSTGEDACWEEIERLQALHGDEGWTFNSLSNAEYYFEEWGFGDLYDVICYYAEQNHSDPRETVIGYKYPVRYDVGPLIGTLWRQNLPYASLCPNWLTGCAAIAAGQLMFYHKYPVTMYWHGEPFTWNDIEQSYVYYPPTKHPELLRMLGQKFQMVYDPSGYSWTTDPNLLNGLDSLGYTANIQYYDVNLPSSHSAALTAAKNELINYHRPVIMQGFETNNSLEEYGHTWVCEGAQEIFPYRLFYYTENQPYGLGNFTQGLYSYNTPGDVGNINSYVNFYMNWGYGDVGLGYNGWYVSNSVNSNYGDFKYSRSNIYVIKP